MCTMLAIMLLKASEPARGVVVGGVVVVVVSDEVGAVVDAEFKGGGREPRPSLKKNMPKQHIFGIVSLHMLH